MRRAAQGPEVGEGKEGDGREGRARRVLGWWRRHAARWIPRGWVASVLKVQCGRHRGLGGGEVPG